MHGLAEALGSMGFTVPHACSRFEIQERMNELTVTLEQSFTCLWIRDKIHAFSIFKHSVKLGAL